MFKVFGKSAVLIILMMVVVSGCSQRELYVQPLNPYDSDRVYGKYAGDEDKNGMVSVTVIGKGIPPEEATSRGQAVLLAERAAIADGYRKLVEKIHGTYVEAYMRMGNGAVNHDVIRMETESWLRGAELLELRKGPFEIVEAHMRARIKVGPKHVLYFKVLEQQRMAQFN